MSELGDVLWSPSADARQRSRVGRYLDWLARERGQHFGGYAELWQWSVDDLAGFWSSVWDHLQVISHTPYEAVLANPAMPGTVWFPGATLNYAEHALRPTGGQPAVIARSQTRGPVDLTADELRSQVARARAGLRRLGVGRGDRVAAYLPNVPETLVAFLAAASLGAIWSSCAPEFGIRSVVDRFRQIEPVLLLTVDGYTYGDKPVDRTAEIAAIRAALPSLRTTVILPYLSDDPGRVPDAVAWADLLAEEAELTFEPLPFGHPLYILYSSGTTGLPKPIVHGHGGITVEHLKALAFGHDLGVGDRFFWFTTTGWMMWNLLVSGLLVGSAVVLYDGNPGHPDLMTLWRLAAETGMTYFGTSAPFLLSCRKQGLRPGREVDLAALRGIGSTGAPLPVEGFDWVYESVKADQQLGSLSGGTDVCTGFVGSSPLLPVTAGEISCRCLGVHAQAYDLNGKPLIGETGELVITKPMPSMPVGFWNDPDGSRFRAAYFDVFPGIWRHGDWITISERGTCVISGRSDSTLNRGGVRLGTSEFYSVVEDVPEVVDSLVTHLDDPAGGPGELLLFVTLRDGATMDDALRRRIAGQLRTELSPRHVPDAIFAVPAVPRTLSGKKLEVPVKRILAGLPVEQAAAKGALADPQSLEPFEELARERAGSARTGSGPGADGATAGG